MGKISRYHFNGLIALSVVLLFVPASTELRNDNHALAELATIGYLVASLAISVLASLLLQPEIPSVKSPIKDTKPSTNAARGVFIPRIIGRRKIAPSFAWVGNRESETVPTGSGGGKGGGGGGGGGTLVYFEDAIHVLCIGPVYKLHNIWVDGYNIFSGGIDQNSHPSGSTIDLDNGDEFVIYWGDGNGPAAPFLQTHIGVLSKWPYICMVIWTPKKLGSVARWPSIEYEIQYRPFTSDLSTTCWILGVFTDSALVKNITNNSNGGPGLGYLVVNGDETDQFVPGSHIRVLGNAIDDGVYEVFNSQWISGPNNTRIFLVEPLEGSNSSGTITLLTEENTNGVNYAHAIHEILFGGYPHGIREEREDFDLNSLSALGELLEGEGIVGSIYAKDGELVKGILAAILQDTGCFISLDPSSGLYRFVPIREANSADDIVEIPDDAILGGIPEIAMDLDERENDRIQFEFADQKKLFRDGTIVFDDDGQASDLDYKKKERVRIATSTSYPSVKKIAARRSQEELSSGTAIKLSTNHASRRLYPGRQISISELDEALIITSLAPVPFSSKVEMETITNFYGVTQSSLDQADDEADEEPGGDIEIPVSASASNWCWFEAPKHLSPLMPKMFALALRTDPEVSSYLIHASIDGSTYSLVGRTALHAAGGVLEDGLDADSAYLIEEGPTFLAQSQDMHIVLDLSGDEDGWLAGKQWLVAQVGDDTEIMFLRSVTALGDDLYRLNGLIRARFDTQRLNLAALTAVYIIPADRILNFSGAILVPGRTIHIKLQAQAGGVLEDLSSISPISRTFMGKGVAPSQPTSLRAGRNKGQPNSFLPGGNIQISWDYTTTANFVGAGATLAGNPWEPSKPEGLFSVEIWDSSDTTLKATYDVFDESSMEYENSELLYDFGGSEPSAFIVKVFEVWNNYTSPKAQILVNRV